jgi:hypothetical protein
MRVKEAPASALRAMFGGIGSLLGVTDKVRAKPAAPEATVGTGTVPPETVATQTVEPEVEAPEAVVPEAVVPEVEVAEVTVVEIIGDDVVVTEVMVAEVVTPEAEASASAVAAPEDVAAEETGGLPLANYGDLSIASLRARLRNLSASQLATLIDYEKSHAARADVITMFERRIVKLNEA